MEIFKKLFGYEVFSWSISGNESATVVKNKQQKINFCFDIGIATPQTTLCDNVFISHGHIDHISALPLHCRKRILNRMSPSKYYLPMKLVEPMKTACQAFSEMHECEDGNFFKPELIGVKVGDTIQINDNWYAEVISTTHRTEVSLGFLLYNKDISSTKPEISYLGDTTFNVFSNSLHANLLMSKIIITELTFIETTLQRQEQSQNYGHTCLADFENNEHIFKNVSFLVFIHFSPRYGSNAIYSAINKCLPKLKNKIYCPLTAQECLY